MLVLTVYVAVFLHRRELTYLNVLIGQVLCEIINGKLKRRIQQHRPTNVLGSGYGMPSSHSQFCGFFAAFWVLHLLAHAPQRCGTYARSYVARVVDRGVALVLIVGLAALTCYSR